MNKPDIEEEIVEFLVFRKRLREAGIEISLPANDNW